MKAGRVLIIACLLILIFSSVTVNAQEGQVFIPKSATDSKVAVKIRVDEKCDINFNSSSYLGVSQAEAVITADDWKLDKDSFWGRYFIHILGLKSNTDDLTKFIPLIIMMVVVEVLGIIMLVVLVLKNKKDL